MRKRFVSAAALLLALVFVLSSCGKESAVAVELVEETAWAVYPSEEAPVKITEEGGVWYAWLGTYGSGDFTLSVSDSYEYFNTVYETSDVTIWYFEANEKYAVWSEISGSDCAFKLYARGTNGVETFAAQSYGEGYQNCNLGLMDESVYFSEIDYTAKTAAILRYDIASGETERFYEFAYAEDYSVMNLSVSGGTLLATGNVGGKTSLVRFDLSAGGAPDVRELPESVDYVYDAAYDTATGAYAVYYKDADGAEHIGVISAKSGDVANIFTFGENVYAYQDTLCAYGGHVYWVNQVNATGLVAEHYSFVDYNYEEHTRLEYLRTFSFTVARDGIYLLSFNGLDYDAIYLSKIYLGGEGK